MEEHIFALLRGALSFPVNWASLGHGIGLPRAAIWRTGGLRDMHLQGTGLMTSRLQIDCYGRTFLQALSASREIRAVLEGYRGDVVQGVFLESMRDGTGTSEAERKAFRDTDQLLQRVSLTFAVTHND